jgi:uncharacterized membrane protein
MFRRYKPGPEFGTDLQRLFAFSDGVFAIAITLLALDLKLPILPDDQAARLPQAVLSQTPSFLSYGISFIVTGAYWNAHHRIFRFISRYDTWLLWLNILFLMTLCFLPFPTLLINRYPNQVFATIFYAATVAGIGLMMNLLWCYAAVGHRLLGDHVHRDQVLQTTVRMITPPALFLASIPFAFYSLIIPKVIWILAMFFRPTIHRKTLQA